MERLSKPVQSYISASRDPFLNLSIEHHILQHANPDAAILLLYVNRPSIIIGRNQNPWFEVNLASLNPSAGNATVPRPDLGKIDLVRRRSGGGTVFHDEGNVNWTVISPAAKFTRDKHAEMVVRALRGCGIARARVNQRHDIVLDQGSRTKVVDPEHTHTTAFQLPDSDLPRPLKVSGSAYKLTRQRALHHGTCLLSSPNLKAIPSYLHSPAKPFITARGVESVSSPVTNIGLQNSNFISAVQSEFANMYHESRTLDPIEVDDDWLQDEHVRKGFEELQVSYTAASLALADLTPTKSLDWTYLQTPLFTLSSTPEQSQEVKLDVTARHGAVTSAEVSFHDGSEALTRQVKLSESIVGRKLHENVDWEGALRPILPEIERQNLVRWLGRMLPKV